MKIFLIRHGESVWNRLNIVQGLGDPGLSDQGKFQAEQVAQALAKEKIDIIYTSPLLRAKDTAYAIARTCDCPVEELGGLREIILGVWEGKSLEEVSRLFKKDYEIWLKRPSKTKIKNAEKISVFKRRVIAAFKSALDDTGHENIAIVAHYGPISVLLSYILKTDFDSLFHLIFIKNASLTTLIFEEGKLSVSSINDTCHLVEPGLSDEKPAGVSASAIRR